MMQLHTGIFQHYSRYCQKKIIAGYTLTTLPTTDMNIWMEELDTIHMHQRETKHPAREPCLGQINDKRRTTIYN